MKLPPSALADHAFAWLLPYGRRQVHAGARARIGGRVRSLVCRYDGPSLIGRLGHVWAQVELCAAGHRERRF